MLNSIFRALQPRTTAYAHCDLPCGVYDPSQARLEAESVKACMEKYHASDDAEFRARAVSIKEERSHMVKEHPARLVDHTSFLPCAGVVAA